ncbi:RHTO0S24e00562g1_1 [Rhodotorula toruloides]|uniref:RHTO0S24e00562g1_1 n=2 Tax=Rhodotorula toruloides TaxID=5286 RepID=A0A061BQ54_RHOTO|nr:aldehyde dehydrogenase [Rhodotorula toruloides NP11]EMS19351.1 aldehyde dehydrogenase [Rhodotorula toruloides NP11]CDR49200.1 RHTO0S24e00562g1_1 [Rhodotorula toruloides]
MDSTTTLTTLSPIDGSEVVKRPYPTSNTELDAAVERSHAAYKSWRKLPLKERIRLVHLGVDHLSSRALELGPELTEQMGRPKKYTAAEFATFKDRASWLLGQAEKALADEIVDDGRPEGFNRIIRRAPVGVCLLVGAWNFPYMIQVNALIPALVAGNSVILKPSLQTPLVAERIQESFEAAGLPKDLIQTLHLTPPQMDYLVSHPLIPFISFTGSVANGKRVEKTAALAAENGAGFKMVGLELGGKDAAYVREDCDPAYAAENVVDGAMFNSGQSCCAVERVYVHESIYDKFVEEVVKVVKGYKLGDPRQDDTTLGPVISLRSAATIREHVSEAVSKGARALIPESHFPEAKEGTTYVAPQVLVDVDHSMKVMSEETFGPVVGIMKVKDDAEALRLINDSPFGLTCSIWTKDRSAYDSLVDDIDAGTVYLNRCDYLDPALPWTGFKYSGRGISLSRYGYDAVTKAKSLHVRL